MINSILLQYEIFMVSVMSCQLKLLISIKFSLFCNIIEVIFCLNLFIYKLVTVASNSNNIISYVKELTSRVVELGITTVELQVLLTLVFNLLLTTSCWFIVSSQAELLGISPDISVSTTRSFSASAMPSSVKLNL